MYAERGRGSDSRESIRVLICHQDIFVRTGFRAIIEKSDNITICGEASTAREFLTEVKRSNPGIVMLGAVPGADGPALIREVQTINGGAIILLGCCRDDASLEGLLVGARGLVCNELAPSDVIATVEHVAQGGAQLPPRMTRRLLDEAVRSLTVARKAPDTVSALSPRELEVLRLVARGISNSEISALLTVSEPTIRSHISHVLQKLALKNRVEATAFAHKYGLVRI